jgi:hypothetical protein
MHGSGRDARSALGTSFREAIASWRLTLHTEVKRASSLPTAMFDACDPMLETRLAETAEAMLAQLHEPDPSLGEGNGPGEQRLEVVTPEELQQLPQRIRGDTIGPLDLAFGISAEYLGVLTDACCSASGIAQQRAAQRLSEDFDVRPNSDLEQLTQELSTHVHEVLGAGANTTVDQDIEATCRRIAAAVTLHNNLHPNNLPNPADATTPEHQP